MAIDATASAARLSLARHLRGDGIEIGPSGKPYPLPAGASVCYLDRWTPEQSCALFPELVGTEVVAPDVIVDVDADGLGPIASDSTDFVIASHVLERVANPISVLDEMHRVLRPGGVALVVLPDRRKTFDSNRCPTPLADVIADYRRQARTVDDAHVLDYLVGATGVEPPGESDRPAVFEWHRQRSVRAHCWSDDEFWPVVGFGIEALDHRWEHVDGFDTGDPSADGVEFGFALRKDTTAMPAPVRWQRWVSAVGAWAAAHRHGDREGEVAELRGEVAALRASTSWRATAPLRRATDGLRGLRARLRPQA